MPRSHDIRTRSLSAAACAALLCAALHAQLEPKHLSALKARSIGPAGMSGRVAAIDALASNPNVVWVGAATGGVWKSANGGLTWTPVFDDQPVASIGAIAIDQKRPDVVWVGTGEGNPRNSSSVGNGIYKTTDGGKTWKHLGLSSSERIHRILLHPENPDVAWAAALGRAWGETAERGVYKTSDGGRTWNRVLHVDEKTGCCDLVLDPSNPDKLLAGMWQFRRWPHHFKSGGAGSGLWISHDGGRNWTRKTTKDGLPKGHLGRIGLAIARSNPEIVYALVEAKKSVLLRSSDGGRSFKTVNSERNVANRPFYYCDLRVDPKDPNRVYNLHSTVTVSEDGGKSFAQLVGWLVHPDHHAMWIDPNDPKLIYEGNDGGVAISRDRGKSWRFVNNLPLAQFYHLAVDMETPYNIYGGMQDNGSWRGPSTVWENAGIRNHHWTELFFGDGFATVPDPDDAKIGYAMSQGGNLGRWNLRTGGKKTIRPDAPDGVDLRFNWNAAIAIDPSRKGTIYYGSQFVHRSADRGDTWQIISPDLTTNNKQWQKQHESGGLTLDVTNAENFCSILTIAPSPADDQVLWVGTDDGRVHVTRNGGKAWTSVEQAISGLPSHTWCPHIEASRFDAATAFAVFDNHRRSDWTPYVYVTRDYGKTWKNIGGGALRGYVHCIEQDPVDQKLLFVGTEFGLFVSRNAGGDWFQWKNGVPTVAVRALVVHPREHDLVIGTHGRAAYVIDDIRPLRALDAATIAKPFHMLKPNDARQFTIAQTGASRFPGSNEYRGTTRPYGATFDFWIGVENVDQMKNKVEPVAAVTEADVPIPAKRAEKKTKGRKPNEVQIEVFDASDERVRKFKRKVERGLNRIVWPLRSDGPKMPSTGGRRRNRGGPQIPAGNYRVVAKFRGHTATHDLVVLPDSRIDVSDEARRAKWKAIRHATSLVEAYGQATSRIDKIREDIATIRKLASRATDAGDETQDSKPHADLIATAKQVEKAIDAIDKQFRASRDVQGIAARDQLGSRVMSAYRSLQSSWDQPTAAQRTYLRQAEADLQKGLADLNALFAERIAEFRSQVRAAKVQLLSDVEPIEIGKK